MTEHEHMAPWPFNVRVMRYAPGTYAVYALSIFLFLTAQVIPEMVIKAIFDSLTVHQDAGFGIPALVALFVAIETARFAICFGATSWQRSCAAPVPSSMRQDMTLDANLELGDPGACRCGSDEPDRAASPRRRCH